MEGEMKREILRKMLIWTAAAALAAACGNGKGGEDADADADVPGDDAAPDPAGDDAVPDPVTDGEDVVVETTDSITQWGVTWTFQDPVPYGTYANGDPWVLAPVVITGISPDFDDLHHGWEVNPAHTSAQGFDTRVGDFDAARVPALPYTAGPGESIVKAVSLEPLDDTECRPCLQTAAVLTVVGEVPPDAGATVLRPPYFGTDKPLYSVTDFRTDLLPSLAPQGEPPGLDEVYESFRRVQLDHKEGWTGRAMHPVDNLPDYGSSISVRDADGALRLLLDDPLEDRMDALIVYVQFGMDLYHMMLGGVTWTGNGGHGEGRKLPMTFAAMMLDDGAMQAAVSAAGEAVFGEDDGVYFSEEADTVLWGQEEGSEDSYWTNLVFDTGSRTATDPYHMIDGGHRPGDSYQFCCTSQPYKANATAAWLVPELRTLWNNEFFFDYVERWVDFGAWTQPDPCAPPDGTCSGGDNAGAACTLASEGSVCTGTDAFCDATVNWDANYGVTYGPDGSGGCIVDTDASDGTGRFPALHGSSADDGYYGSAFANAMFTAYVAPTL
jgi:hypothetical protein